MTRRERGKPTDFTPDTMREAPASFRPTFGEFRTCTACKGKQHQKGHTDRPCLTCIDTPGYERITPMRRADPPPN